MVADICNADCEDVILGCLLSNSKVLLNFPDLRAEHFFFTVNQYIFEFIEKRTRSGELITLATAALELENIPGALSMLRGTTPRSYLAAQLGKSAGVFYPKGYVDELVELANRRTLYTSLESCMHKLAAPKTGESYDDIATEVFAACMRSSGNGSAALRPSRKVTADIIDDMQRELPCYSTGIPKLDTAMGGGLWARRNYGIAARPKNGKTVLLGTISHNLVKQGVPHVYICAEMGEKEIHMRYIARDVKENSLAFYKKRKDTAFVGKLVQHQKSISTEKDVLWYVDKPCISFQDLQRCILTAVKKYGAKGYILDYLQLVTGKDRHENKVEHYENVANWLGYITKEMDIFGIYAAQRNREGLLRGGDAILMAADQVYSLEYDDERRTAFMTMEATRYTPRQNVGNKEMPGLKFNTYGPYFADIDEDIHNQPQIEF